MCRRPGGREALEVDSNCSTMTWAGKKLSGVNLEGKLCEKYCGAEDSVRIIISLNLEIEGAMLNAISAYATQVAVTKERGILEYVGSSGGECSQRGEGTDLSRLQ